MITWFCILGTDSKHVGGVDVTDDVVDVFVIDDDLAVATLDEGLFELLDSGSVFNGINLRTGHHTVTNLRFGEVEGVLEDFHFLANLVFIFGIIDTGLHEVVEIDFRELAFFVLLGHTDAHQSEESFGEEGCQTGDGIEDDVTEPGRDGKDGEHRVGRVLEDGLRKELTCEEDDDCGEEGIEGDAYAVAEWLEQRGVEDTCEEDAIDDEGDVVAHKHGRDKVVRVLIEDADGLLGQTVFLTVHLCQETIARDKGDLHTRKEGGEEHRDDETNDEIRHIFYLKTTNYTNYTNLN